VKFRPNSKAQERFVLDDVHRVAVALDGRGSGKTHANVVKCIRHCMDYPGAKVWFVGPDDKRLREGLLEKFQEICPPNLIRERRLGDKEFILANEGKIGWRSTDVLAGLRAGEQSFACFDEAAWAPYNQAQRAYSDLRAGLRLFKRRFWCDNDWISPDPWVEVLETGSSSSFIEVTYKQQLAISSTPRRRSYLNELLEVPPPGVAIYQLHTEDNAANLTPGYLDELRAAYPNAAEYAQEALGEMTGTDSPDYPDFDTKKHVLGGPGAYNLVVGGIDWGYRNALAVIVMGFTSSGAAFAIEEWGGSHIDLDQIVLKTAELQSKYGIRVFFCDQASPQNISFLNRNGVPAVKQAVILKSYRTAAVLSRFQKTQAGTYRLYIDPSMRQTIRQLRFAGEEVDDPAKLREVKSGKPDNDYLDALEYAVTGGERLLGNPFIPVVGRESHREGSTRQTIGVPFRFLG